MNSSFFQVDEAIGSRFPPDVVKDFYGDRTRFAKALPK
jgi:hypothetical protein